MATRVKIYDDHNKYGITVAVEAGKDDANREGVHVHVYKNGRRTDARIPGSGRGLTDEQYDAALKLYNTYYSDICRMCKAVAEGKYDK